MCVMEQGPLSEVATSLTTLMSGSPDRGEAVAGWRGGPNFETGIEGVSEVASGRDPSYEESRRDFVFPHIAIPLGTCWPTPSPPPPRDTSLEGPPGRFDIIDMIRGGVLVRGKPCSPPARVYTSYTILP